MPGSEGVTLKVICLDGWQRRDNALAVRVMFVNQPPPRVLSSVPVPLPLSSARAGADAAVEAGSSVAACCVGGTSVGGGIWVGISVGRSVGMTVTTTVCTITAAVCVGWITSSVGACVGVTGGA